MSDLSLGCFLVQLFLADSRVPWKYPPGYFVCLLGWYFVCLFVCLRGSLLLSVCLFVFLLVWVAGEGIP